MRCVLEGNSLMCSNPQGLQNRNVEFWVWFDEDQQSFLLGHVMIAPMQREDEVVRLNKPEREHCLVTTPYPFSCILLSGMPCTGKDTLSLQLVQRDPVFALLRKHRAVSASSFQENERTYINVLPETFQTILKNNGFIQFHERYGKMYGVSKSEYTALVQAQKVPIIHVGKYENLPVLRQGGLQEGLSVLLWADRSTVRSRLQERHRHRTDGIEERLVAYDQEVAQLWHTVKEGHLDFDLVFENNGADPCAASEALLTLLRTPSAWSKEVALATLMRLLRENRATMS